MKKLIELDAALEGLENLNAISFYDENEHSKEVYMEVKAMLKALPSAQQWIPVTERLPCESDMVLATCGYRNVQNTSIIWVRRLYLYGGTWRYPDDEVYTENVYAWMPLPEPYCPEGDEDNVHKPD